MLSKKLREWFSQGGTDQVQADEFMNEIDSVLESAILFVGGQGQVYRGPEIISIEKKSTGVFRVNVNPKLNLAEFIGGGTTIFCKGAPSAIMSVQIADAHGAYDPPYVEFRLLNKDGEEADPEDGVILTNILKVRYNVKK